MSVPFKDYSHQNMFRMMRSQLPDTVRKNKDVSIVAFIMSGNEAMRKLINPYLNWEDGTLLYEKMIEDAPEGDKESLKVVAELYSDREYVSLNSLVQVKDSDLFDLFLSTIRLKRYGFENDYVQADNTMNFK
ncbi:hypothetical protein AAXB25_22630 [Paenibacillus lautus]|uniref:hypothetical protein n=1 Tax=Paenibacillus lautus TaxID=1401 RepID=UPI003D27852A